MIRPMILAATISVLGVNAACSESADHTMSTLSVLAAIPTNPTVKFTNNAATQSYVISASATCSPAVLTFTNVANGTTTAEQTLTAGSYYIGYGAGPTCIGSAYSFPSGTTLIPRNMTCTATGATTISCL